MSAQSVRGGEMITLIATASFSVPKEAAALTTEQFEAIIKKGLTELGVTEVHDVDVGEERESVWDSELEFSSPAGFNGVIDPE